MQGVLDCRDDAQIDFFLEQCAHIPTAVVPGDLTRREAQLQQLDNCLLAPLNGTDANRQAAGETFEMDDLLLDGASDCTKGSSDDDY